MLIGVGTMVGNFLLLCMGLEIPTLYSAYVTENEKIAHV